MRLHYQLIDLAPTGTDPGAGDQDLAQLLQALRAIGFAGFNVTVPYKQVIVPLLDGLSVEAGLICNFRGINGFCLLSLVGAPLSIK